MTESETTDVPVLPEGVTEKYRMVDNPDGSGTKVREYYYADAEGNEVTLDQPAEGGAFTDAVEPAEQHEPYDAEAASESLKSAIEVDDERRKAWAEAGGDRIGDPPDPSVNATAPDITAPPADPDAVVDPDADPDTEPA